MAFSSFTCQTSLLGFVESVRAQARQADPELAEALGRESLGLTAAFSEPLDARFERVLRFYREYDLRILRFLHPVPVTDWFGELRDLTLELLQAYWREMGREHYAPDSFPHLPSGTRVRLRRGALQVMDVLRGITEHVGWASSRGVWVVDERCDTDVDGVPVYWVERENGREGAVARQTALLPA